MVNITINGRALSVPEGTTILEAARGANVKIPTLCYFKDLNDIGACRVCVVEVVGNKKLAASCRIECEEGMEILTNSPRVRQARRTNVELILSQHDGQCTTCERSGTCKLQSVAADLGINKEPYEKKLPKRRPDYNFPLVRDEQKCIKCGRCIQVCDNVQSIGIWNLVNTGSRTTVGVSGNRELHKTDCVLCGQCITHCPTGALTARNDIAKVMAKLADPDVVTVMQVAPAVRAAWGEYLGLTREEASPLRMASAMRRIGFNYVFDTNFTADLTIMEEGSEFLDKLTHAKDHKWPMFTSCCPGWVRFLKGQYPDMVPQLSSAKSPQQMFGAVAKTYFADKIGVDPANIYVVSIMPCSAKKHECEIPVMNDAGHGPDVDVVLTTRELVSLIRSEGIDVATLPEEAFDSPLGSGTGAAVIFGATGGVMEAALRSAYFLVVGENPDPDAFAVVRNPAGWREATFEVKGIPVRTAVVSGLANTRQLIEALRAGEVEYDFVEVMACPGGCVGGGGQPIHDGQELAGVRGENLYKLDKESAIRFSHENTDVAAAYKEYFEAPLSHKSHHLLHTDHEAWQLNK